MQEGRDPIRDACKAVWDGLSQIGDFSYAILPRDLAHSIGNLKKDLLYQIRGAVDWEVDWINARVAGGDKLREEWRKKCEREQQASADATSGPAA